VANQRSTFSSGKRSKERVSREMWRLLGAIKLEGGSLEKDLKLSSRG